MILQKTASGIFKNWLKFIERFCWYKLYMQGQIYLHTSIYPTVFKFQPSSCLFGGKLSIWRWSTFSSFHQLSSRAWCHHHRAWQLVPAGCFGTNQCVFTDDQRKLFLSQSEPGSDSGAAETRGWPWKAKGGGAAEGREASETHVGALKCFSNLFILLETYRNRSWGALHASSFYFCLQIAEWTKRPGQRGPEGSGGDCGGSLQDF